MKDRELGKCVGEFQIEKLKQAGGYSKQTHFPTGLIFMLVANI